MSTVVFGSKIEEAWRWLIDEETCMIGIHGVGGVGKTTLLKQIYRRLTISPHIFDTVIWITVSQNLSSEKVQDDIWKRIGVFNVEWVDKSFQQKAEAIWNVLSKKKFVLLIDDLAERLDLRNLGVLDPDELELEDEPAILLPSDLELPFKFTVNEPPNNKCKVIFTTRSQQVCSEMSAQAVIPIKSLDWENAWELFQAMVGKDKLCDPNILEMAQLIAQSCRGLPMLLRTVGRAMAQRTTFEQWEAAIKVTRSALARGQNKYIFPSPKQVASKTFVPDGEYYVDVLLQFCFDSLDSQVKSCLIYYCLFPEDFAILKKELIDFWVCEQLLPSDDLEDVLSSGYQTLDALVWTCLLEEEQEQNYVKLLDLIRDAASRVRNISKLPVPSIDIKVLDKKLEAGWVLPLRNFIQGMSFSHNFFTFLLKHNPFVMVKGDAFLNTEDASRKMKSLLQHRPDFINKCLTVLDLSHSGVENIPGEIAELVSLEYLNLSHTWIDYLPIEMKKLANLKCLNLEYDEQLRVIPKELVYSLSSLQVLKMFRCGFSVEEIEDNIMSATHMDIDPIFHLENLKVLSITITCDHALGKFFSNRKLLNSTQSLSLEIFWGTKSLDISQVATMKNLLTLEVHQVEKLKELNGLPPPSEFTKERSFEQLQEITFEKCSSLRELTWVILVPNLKILIVRNCEKIEAISSRIGEILDDEEGFEPFAKLELLELESLPELISIYWKALTFERLERIKVMDCCLLKKLPLYSESGKENEFIIEAEEGWWNYIEWEDDITRNKFLQCVKLVELD